MRRLAVLVIAASLLAGCAMPRTEIAGQAGRTAGIPEQFSLYAEKVEQGTPWWQDFASEDLDRLMAAALTDNFSVREAWARLTQAQSVAVKAGAAAYPEFTGRSGLTHTDKDSSSGASGAADEWLLGLAASYEVDLWGRVRAERENLQLLADASAEDLQAAIMTISGQVGENWLSLISVRKQHELFSRQLQLQEQLLELITSRFPLGRSTALDIYRQQQVVEKIRAALIPLAGSEAAIRRQLALLTGKATLTAGDAGATAFPVLASVPAIGLPADLLASRPDIRAAGLRLDAVEWQVTAARADRLPALKLSAAHTFSGDTAGSVFDNWMLNLAGSLAGPVFDGRRRQAEVERTRAIAAERLATYQKTVFAAIKEVEDALADEQQHAATLESLKHQYALSAKTIREAKSRYLNGNSDFINVLREELNIIQIQQDAITTEEKLVASRIRLYRALGGSWLAARHEP